MSKFLKLAMQRWPDKRARLTDGFYSVLDENGQKIPFKARPQQLKFLDEQHGLDILLKARQLGFTTLIQLDYLDDCLFTPNIAAGIIAHNREDAEAFFSTKIKFAYDQLPPEFKALVGAEQNSAKSLKFTNGSSIRVGTSLRSGTFQRLHISEYAKVCAKYPDKAREIRTGALNTVHTGQKIRIESTAEGRTGHFYDLCKSSQDKALLGTELTALDFKFHFFPWWEDEKYQMAGEPLETAETVKYFSDLEEQGVTLTRQQRSWWIKKAEQQGDDMKREFPATPKEAFEASIEGAYFSSQMTKMRQEGRICKIPVLDKPVYTTWDLGYNDMMAIVFWQDVGMERRAIDYYENSGEGFGHYADVLRRKGYSYDRHYMPHDADHHMLTVTATTRRQEAYEAGIEPIDVLDRIDKELTGIDKSRAFLPQVYIDEQRCDRLIKCLDNYRKEWDERLGTWKSHARHDEFSHGYKAFESAAIRPVQMLSKPIRTGMRVGIV